MNSIAYELSTSFGIEVINIEKDFFNCNNDPINFFGDIYKKCENLDISVIINNIGLGIQKPFTSSLQIILQQLSLNIFPVVFLTRLFFTKLSNRKQGAAIINLSSITGTTIVPGIITSSAGKSFNYIFSDTVAEETGIDLLCLQPGFIETSMSKGINHKPLSVQPDDVVESAFKSLGRVKCSRGHWKHEIGYIYFMFARLLLEISSKSYYYI